MTFTERIQKTIKHYSRYNQTYFRNKFYDRTLRKYIESKFDLRQIYKEYPDLKQLYNQNITSCRHEILPFYQDYISNTSNAIMAISFELSILLLTLCEVIKPKRIIDFGSGFSSFIFRYFAMNHTGIPMPEVWSVDDSQEWLDKTGEFLISKNIKGDNLFTLESIKQKKDIPFDLILYDLGAFDIRIMNLELALSMLSQDGTIVLDDMHGADYAFFVLNSLRNNKFKKYSTYHYTIDKINRYAFIAKHEKENG
ncbi:MAG: hypothetical protein ACLQBQ_07010 [Smithella sp.]